MINLQSIKSFLWFTAIVIVALAFPLQVLTHNPYPSLLPYPVIALILLLHALYSGNRSSRQAVPLHRNISELVTVYSLLVVIDTGWQAALGVITVYEGMTAFTIYLLPVAWFWYFRRTASRDEIRAVLIAIVIAGAIVAAFFAYDSYMKLGLGRVSNYAQEAFQYSLNRRGLESPDANDTRVRMGYRSFGLLETHSVSGAWVVLGAIAALSLAPRDRRAMRVFVILFFGTMLLLGLNFTSIMAFLIIMFLVEFGGLTALTHKGLPGVLRSLAPLILIIVLAVSAALLAVGSVMSQFILENLAFQKDLALGTGDIGNSMIELARTYLRNYGQHVSEYPWTLLIGDGFSTYGMAKGGDIGFVESMAKVGLPFFITAVYGLVKLVAAASRRLQTKDKMKHAAKLTAEREAMLRFAICVTLLLLITDGHYSVWAAKSILPIIFFALALYDRYLGEAHERVLGPAASEPD